MSVLSGTLTTLLGALPGTTTALHFFTDGGGFLASATVTGAAYTITLADGTYNAYVEPQSSVSGVFPAQWIGGDDQPSADTITVAGATSLDLYVFAVDEVPEVPPEATGWPTLDELKQLLDITSEDWDGDSDDTRLTRVLASAIDLIKVEISGSSVVFDDIVVDPTDSQAQAALRLAELIATRPDAGVSRAGSDRMFLQDVTVLRLLKGSRRSFGI